jgi:hypothetical protein
MKPKFHVVATLGSYKDKDTRKTIKRYLTVGTVFESPGGNLFMRLDALPASPDWSGFLSFRPVGSAAPTTEEAPDTTTAPPAHCLVLPPELAAVIRESGFSFAVGMFADDEPGQPARLHLFECSRPAAVAAGKFAMHYDDTAPPAA